MQNEKKMRVEHPGRCDPAAGIPDWKLIQQRNLIAPSSELFPTRLQSPNLKMLFPGTCPRVDR